MNAPTEDMIERGARALAHSAGDGAEYDRGEQWALDWRNEAEIVLRAALTNPDEGEV